jgi:Ni,Fe-hydrogenase III component G
MQRPSTDRLDATVTVDTLLSAVQGLAGPSWGYLSAITGLDDSQGPAPEQDPAGGQMTVLYHFCQGPFVTTLRLDVPLSAAKIPSICGIVPSAVLYERELAEMFGLTIDGIPDDSRLLLPDDWPAEVYPLRKSFQGLPAEEPKEE